MYNLGFIKIFFDDRKIKNYYFLFLEFIFHLSSLCLQITLLLFWLSAAI